MVTPHRASLPHVFVWSWPQLPPFPPKPSRESYWGLVLRQYFDPIIPIRTPVSPPTAFIPWMRHCGCSAGSRLEPVGISPVHSSSVRLVAWYSLLDIRSNKDVLVKLRIVHPLTSSCFIPRQICVKGVVWYVESFVSLAWSNNWPKCR